MNAEAFTDAHIAAVLRGLIIERARRGDYLNDLIYKMRRRHVGEPIIARVKRLNPEYYEGTIPRGIHYKKTLKHRSMTADLMGKRAFISRFGRAAFDAAPSRAIFKDGRRVGISYEYVLGL